MNKLFCVSCGFKILYEVTKPKFCSSCGEPIGSISSSAKAEEQGEVEETSMASIDLDKLKRGISVEANSSKQNLKDIWGGVTEQEAQAGGMGRMERAPSKDPEGQALLDQIMNECASSRMKDVDEP